MKPDPTGFAISATQRLMDPELWTEPSGHPRYLGNARA